MDWLAEGEEIRQQYSDVYITSNRVVWIQESFSTFSSESIGLDHLTAVFAYKRRLTRLIAGGVVMLIIFTLLFWYGVIPLVAYAPSSASILGTVFLGLDLLAVILVVLGFFLGPKEVTFEADSGSVIVFKPSNASEIEEVLKWFGALK